MVLCSLKACRIALPLGSHIDAVLSNMCKQLSSEDNFLPATKQLVQTLEAGFKACACPFRALQLNGKPGSAIQQCAPLKCV
eukprot:scaffold320329_cov18-Tisochrysis_lutea.AAC.1